MTELSLSEYANRPKPDAQRLGVPRTGLVVVCVLLLAGGSFVAGMQYQKSKRPAAATMRTASSQRKYGSPDSGQGGLGGFRRGDRAFGTVSSVSSSSITIQTRRGGTSTYTITGSTTVTNDGQSASVSDIQNGDIAILTLDSSNTQDVSSILLNPGFGGDGSPSSSDQNNANASNV